MSDQLKDNHLEQIVLGALFYEPKALSVTKAVIDNMDFFCNQAHRAIYTQMLDAEGNFDELTIGGALKKLGNLKMVGGYEYLSSLSESLPEMPEPMVSVSKYSKLLRELYIQRQTIVECEKLTQKINAPRDFGNEKDALTLVETIGASVSRLRELQVKMEERSNHTQSVRDISIEVFHEIELGLKGEYTPALSTGFSNLDEHLGGGLYKGEFNIIAARPSVGKTALAVNIANNMSPGKRILFNSLETTRKSIVRDRLLPVTARVSSTHIRIPQKMGRDELDKITGSIDTFGEYSNFVICDQSSMTVDDIEMTVGKTLKEGDLLIIDYVQLIKGSRKFQIREQEIADISRKLKGLIKEYGIYSIVVAQLNRELEKANREPKLSDLRESGSLEADADTVILLHEDKDNEDAPMLLKIAKNKNGPQGRVELHFNKRHTRFEAI